MSTSTSAMDDPSVQAILKAKDETIQALKNKSAVPETVVVKPWPWWKTSFGKVFIIAFSIVLIVVLVFIAIGFTKVL